MAREKLDARLSRLSTMWTVLREAHTGDQSASAAQQLLIERYRGAVHRYLLAALRDPHEADELTQAFCLGLVRGEFRRADPGRGRFRDYVKTVLFHLVSKQRKRAAKAGRPLAADDPALTGLAAAEYGEEEEFDRCWRDELLTRTWAALREMNPSYHLTLHTRAAHPEATSAELARRLSDAQGKPVSAESARQTLSRAREAFADLLLDEVARSLDAPSRDAVTEELLDLGILEYCKPALRRRG